MRKMKSICRVAVMCVCLILGGILMPVTSNAQGLNVLNVQAQPRMTDIMAYKVELSINSSGLASVTAFVIAKSDDASVYVTATLQRYVSGRWENVKVWEDSRVGLKASVVETYQVARGTYRVVMNCGANTEHKSFTSAERTY